MKRKRTILLILSLGLLSFVGIIVSQYFYWGKNDSFFTTSSPLSLSSSLPYSDVSWLCSHNAMSNSEGGWFLPNQNWSISRQLEEGIHVQMWDVWEKEGKLILEHGNGKFALPGKIDLQKAIGIVVDYLESHPQAIITLLFESYVSNEKLRDAFIRGGAEKYCYHQLPTEQWPTLGELRLRGKRLILFTDKHDGITNWPMPMWSHCTETPWEVTSEEQFSASYKRGKPDNTLFIANHFLTSPIAMPSLAEKANTEQSLNKHKNIIENKLGRKPQFWVLDFVDIGEGRKFIESLLLPRNDRDPSR